MLKSEETKQFSSKDFHQTLQDQFMKTNTSYPQECGKSRSTRSVFHRKKTPCIFVDLPSKNVKYDYWWFTTRTVDESPSPYLRNRTLCNRRKRMDRK